MNDDDDNNGYHHTILRNITFPTENTVVIYYAAVGRLSKNH